MWQRFDPTARIRSLLGLFLSLVPAGRCTGGLPFLRMLGIIALPACLYGFAGGLRALFRRKVASPSFTTFAPYLCRVDQSHFRSSVYLPAKKVKIVLDIRSFYV